MRAGSDERVECVCTRKLLEEAPVVAHQSEVITVGMLSGWEKVEVEEGGMGNGNALWVMTMEIFLGWVGCGIDWGLTFSLDPE